MQQAVALVQGFEIERKLSTRLDGRRNVPCAVGVPTTIAGSSHLMRLEANG